MRWLLLPLLCISLLASAQQSERFGPYELHYSVVNTTFLQPEVAATYGIKRGVNNAILNLAVREHLEGRTEGRPMLLKGRSWDLMNRGGELEFLEVREGPAIYYIAEFEFLDREWLHFEVDFRPEGADKTFQFKHKHKLFVN